MVHSGQSDHGGAELRRDDPPDRHRLGHRRSDHRLVGGDAVLQFFLSAAGRHAGDRRSAQLGCAVGVSPDGHRHQPALGPCAATRASKRAPGSAIWSSSIPSAARCCSAQGGSSIPAGDCPPHCRRIRTGAGGALRSPCGSSVSWAGATEVPGIERRLRDVARNSVTFTRPVRADGPRDQAWRGANRQPGDHRAQG